MEKKTKPRKYQKYLTIRVDRELVLRLRALVKEFKKEQPHIPWSTSSVARSIIFSEFDRRGLKVDESE